MQDCSVEISDDGVTAVLFIPKEGGSPKTIDELRLFLQKHHVVFGMKEELFAPIVQGVLNGQRLVIAHGTPVIKGEPGRVKLLVDLSVIGKPRELADGRVDLRDLQIDVNVQKGCKLARRIPAVQGSAGMSVSGYKVFPPEVEDALLVTGAGTRWSEEEPGTAVAAGDGAVIFDGITLEVRNCKVIRGDVDYATGNVTFNGDLKITGTVRSGFSVEASGDILICGDVEDARVHGNGAVVVLGGAIGSSIGTITCTGSLAVRHVAHFSLYAGKDVQVKEDILHTTVVSGGGVTAKSILGGEVTAFSIIAGVVGSSAEIRTILDIGRKEQLKKEHYQLFKQLGIETTRQVSLREEMYQLVAHGMDESGLVSENDITTLDSFKHNTLQSIQNSRKIQKRIEEIEVLENVNKVDSVISAHVINPNTVVKVGKEERLIMEVQNNVTITA